MRLPDCYPDGTVRCLAQGEELVLNGLTPVGAYCRRTLGARACHNGVAPRGVGDDDVCGGPSRMLQWGERLQWSGIDGTSRGTPSCVYRCPAGTRLGPDGCAPADAAVDAQPDDAALDAATDTVDEPREPLPDAPMEAAFDAARDDTARDGADAATLDASLDASLDAASDAPASDMPSPPDRGEPVGDARPPDTLTSPCGVRSDGVACTPGAPGCDVVELALGGFHCARFTDGSVRCWGEGIHGDGTAGSCGTPSLVQGLRGATQVAVGHYFACARVAAGAACWGDNPHGQFGNGASGTRAMAPLASSLPAGALVFGTAVAGALTPSGVVYTWGYAGSYSLGDGTVTNRATPTALELPPTRALTLGSGFGCAAPTGSGAARCWGANNVGQTGQSAGSSVMSPRAVAELTDVAEMSAGPNFACARQSDGVVLCWGANLSGQLGRGTTNTGQPRPAPVVDLAAATQVAASGYGACALVAGEVWCWGGSHTLGTGAVSSSARPVRVPGLSGVRAIEAGANAACAWLGGADVRCWGSWVGDGTSRAVLTPSRVVW